MDFITQTLLGAIAAQATMTGKLGRSAFLIGALGGAMPDFDSAATQRLLMESRERALALGAG